MLTEHIPNYGLYGESRESAAAAGIHIEEIAERSKGQDWVIKPHRHGKLFQALCVFDGEASVQLDEHQHKLDGWCLVTIPIGVVHGFSFKPRSEGYVITLSEEILGSISQLQDPHYASSVFETAAVIDMREKSEQRKLLQHYIALMQQEFTALNDAKHAALLALANLLTIVIKRQMDFQVQNQLAASSNTRTCDTFRKLVEEHYKEHWQVSEYARELNVSTSTLNRMCAQRFGCSAKAIIVARLISEARRRLLYTQQQLDQISYNLGYRDPAYFSRVFKKVEGISPGEYRKQKRL